MVPSYGCLHPLHSTSSTYTRCQLGRITSRGVHAKMGRHFGGQEWNMFPFSPAAISRCTEMHYPGTTLPLKLNKEDSIERSD